jgi:hypothetical protein
LQVGQTLASYVPELEQLRSGGPEMIERQSNIAPYCGLQ